MKVISKPVEYTAELIDKDIEYYMNNSDYLVNTQCENQYINCPDGELREFDFKQCRDCRWCNWYLKSLKANAWVGYGNYVVYNDNEGFVVKSKEELMSRFEVVADEN